MMGREVIAAVMAASSELDLMTLDRIEACTKGHGSLNIAVLGIVNVVAEELQRGADISVKFWIRSIFRSTMSCPGPSPPHGRRGRMLPMPQCSVPRCC